ncbi:hypothetical protein G7068_02225 [Leucobacter viscericola]|uniref:Uncharacterized protein n=1 Tax=Leucobacter viscericola TaxID=2714935 RepID=A0A6G7XCQ2_9MICO|nr:hypothetical protein [Leucobacter viscericola]QIK62148.1 hypothetical protein G7068_02225 [Leucobacter viscericola]
MIQEPYSHSSPGGRTAHENDEVSANSLVRQKRQRKSNKQRCQEQSRTCRVDRWEAFKILIALPLVAVVFTVVGLLMMAEAVTVRDGGAFGFALMALGLGVGLLGLNVVHYLEYLEERAARRSAPTNAHESRRKIVDAAQQDLSQEKPITELRRRRSTTTRNSEASSRHYFLIIPSIVTATCWAIGVGFMLFGYGPGYLVGGVSKSVPVWVLALLVWGGLGTLGITMLVRHIMHRREE